MNKREKIQDLISQGLDGELDRRDIRRLFLQVARDPETAAEMGRMAALEESLVALETLAVETSQGIDLVGQVERRLDQEKKPHGVRRRESFWSWLTHPRGISFQPLSFAAGLALAMVPLLWLQELDPRLNSGLEIISGEAPVQTEAPFRLQINDIQLVDADDQPEWTNRFIVRGGSSTRVALGSGSEQPVLLQFETMAPVTIRLVHDAPGTRRDPVKILVVDGFGYASLENPRPGDAILIQNGGVAPVLVAMRGPDSDQTYFSRLLDKNEGPSL